MSKGDVVSSPRPRLTPIKRAHLAIDWTNQHLAWVPSVINAGAVIGAAVCFAFIGEWPNDVHPGFAIGGCICTGLSLILTFMVDSWRRQNREGETTEAAQLQVAVSDAIQPLVQDLAKMTSKTASQRTRALGKMFGSVGTSLKLVLPQGKRIRIVVYSLKLRKDGKRELFVESNVGRGDVPRKFIEGDGGRGDAVFQMLAGGKSIFVADVRKLKLPGWEESGSSYRTFISSPIVADDNAFGMLSVDSPEPGDLDETDQPLVDVIAALLAVAFAEVSRGA